jgi:hypothetical protein
MTTNARRARTHRSRLTVAAAVTAVVALTAACGGGDDSDSGAPASSDDTSDQGGGATATDAPTDGGGDASASAGTPGGATQSLPGGYDLTYLGWSPWPFTDAAPEAAFTNINDAEPPLALRFEVCATADATPMSSGELLFAAGDATGTPIVELRSVTTGPIVSPALLAWPTPGTCSTGWVQPNVTVGVEPATAMWIQDWDDTMPVLSWPIGDPYVGLEHPVDGDVLNLGEPFTVADNATWTVHGVERIPAADPTAVVPEGAYYNAGSPFDQPPAGYEWAVVDAEYCFGDNPGTISENLGLAVDGWATQIALDSYVNVDADHLVELDDVPDTANPCIRKDWYAPVALDAQITAITSTFGAGPWWLLA